MTHGTEISVMDKYPPSAFSITTKYWSVFTHEPTADIARCVVAFLQKNGLGWSDYFKESDFRAFVKNDSQNLFHQLVEGTHDVMTFDKDPPTDAKYVGPSKNVCGSMYLHRCENDHCIIVNYGVVMIEQKFVETLLKNPMLLKANS